MCIIGNQGFSEGSREDCSSQCPHAERIEKKEGGAGFVLNRVVGKEERDRERYRQTGRMGLSCRKEEEAKQRRSGFYYFRPQRRLSSFSAFPSDHNVIYARTTDLLPRDGCL